MPPSQRKTAAGRQTEEVIQHMIQNAVYFLLKKSNHVSKNDNIAMKAAPVHIKLRYQTADGEKAKQRRKLCYANGQSWGRGNAHEQRRICICVGQAQPHHAQNRAVHRAGLHSGDGSHCDADGHSALLFQHGAVLGGRSAAPAGDGICFHRLRHRRARPHARRGERDL